MFFCKILELQLSGTFYNISCVTTSSTAHSFVAAHRPLSFTRPTLDLLVAFALSTLDKPDTFAQTTSLKQAN